MSINVAFHSSFFLLRNRVEEEIAKGILSLGEKSKLRDACEYALLSGGKRLRPIIVLMVAEALGNGLDVAPAALAVEFMHTASLIADDLPCMDDDDKRRDQPSLHRAYGEATALLSSFSLIFAGYKKIEENAQQMRKAPLHFSSMADAVCCLCLKEASSLAGILGATGGQHLDLYPPGEGIEVIREVFYKKTVTLFQVSFLFGWLYGGGELCKVDLVKEVAYHFGMAFQIIDDLGDMAQDVSNQREVNIACILGPKRAAELLEEEIGRYQELLEKLGLNTPSFEKMTSMLVEAASSL